MFAMPKPTFHKLPEKKRARIIEAALDEFASVPFEAASVNRIVRAAGIAKGSFYQYFDGMVDLYQHLFFGVWRERKVAAIRASGFQSQGGLFAQLAHAAAVSLRLALTEPKLMAAAMPLRYPLAEDHPLRPLQDRLRQQQQRAYEAILTDGVRSGAVRADVNVSEAAVLTITLFQHGLDPLMRLRLGFDTHTLIHQPELADTVDDSDLAGVVEALVDSIRRGIGADPDAGALALDVLDHIARERGEP